MECCSSFRHLDIQGYAPVYLLTGKSMIEKRSDNLTFFFHFHNSYDKFVGIDEATTCVCLVIHHKQNRM